MKKRDIVGSICLFAVAVIFACCAWQIIGRVYNSPSNDVHPATYYAQSSSSEQMSDDKPMELVWETPNYHAISNTVSPQAIHAKAHSSSIPPFTHRASDAQVQHIGGGIDAGNSIWTVSSGQSENRNRSVVSTATSVWSGTVSPVASSMLAYVEAPSGALSQELFAPTIRRAPPDEEGNGTNGPNIEQDSPVGEGVGILIILSLIYILQTSFFTQVKHCTFAQIDNYKNTSI